jgi:beta-galactosidase beta subunit
MRFGIRAVVVIAAIFGWISPALAWGPEGHRVVAMIAASELSPKARAGVAALLGGDATAEMVRVSTWADEIRHDRPETAPWHYVNIPIGSSGYDAARDCPQEDCVVGQIERDIRIVGDRSLAKPVRVEALKFLIHFVGDVHQPLHAADNDDRGGNAVRVILNGERTNLHAVWDHDVVEALGSDPGAVARRLEQNNTPAERRRWSGSALADWANGSFKIASQEIYGRLHGRGGARRPLFLPANYATAESPIAARQLEKAGLRLAWVLNAVFW